MTFNFKVSENPNLKEEVEFNIYKTYLTLELVSVVQGEETFEAPVKESLRKFLGENLYDLNTTQFEYFLRGVLFGSGMVKTDINKAIKKIKNKWKKTHDCGDYTVEV